MTRTPFAIQVQGKNIDRLIQNVFIKLESMSLLYNCNTP